MELAIALIALAGVIIAQLITLKSQNQQYLQAKAELNQRQNEFTQTLEDARRTEWKNYLIDLMMKLIEARYEYERFLGTDRTDKEALAGIVGKAIAVCLAANNSQLATIAREELTPYFSDKVKDDGTTEIDWASRNRNALHDAVLRLAEIIRTS